MRRPQTPVISTEATRSGETPVFRRCSHGLRRCGSAWIAAFAFLALALGARAAEYHGRVLFGGVPVPGATVTLTQGTQQVSTSTDAQGLYEFPDIAEGAWTIRIAMRDFEPLESSITVGTSLPQPEWALKLLSLDQLLADTHAAPQTPPPLQTHAPEAVAATDATAPQQPAAAKPRDAAQPAVPVEEAAERPADGLLINGSVNNAATSPFTLTPAFGNRRANSKSLYNGGIGVVINNAVFNAKPYSLTGLEVPKDQYSRVTALFTLGGPLRIPHLLPRGPNFFVAYQWTRNRDATTAPGLVPTVAERGGDLSGLLNSVGQPVTIYNPATGQPFSGAVPVSPQAAALLNLYPLPNVAGNARYNYETEVLSNTHVDALQSRLNKSLGRRDQLYGGFGFQSVRADSANLFNFRDTTDILGLDTSANWSHRFLHQLFVTAGYHFTRQRTNIQPQFENRANISGNAGITGNDQDPANWGPPSLTFSSGIASLSDAVSTFNRNRTDAVSLKATMSRGRHNVTIGGDFRWQEFNEFTQENPRGSFTFTGAATGAGGAASATSGSDLADFLIGVPDASTLSFGNPDKYFRQSVYDGYATDDWRVRPELTINAGMRWEYGAPLTELFGRLVNLDVTSGTTSPFAAIAPVLGSSPTGSLTGTAYPSSLIRPDRRGFEPRIGISWRPLPASTLVVRAGYGIYDDTSTYLSSAQQMAQQAPLSKSVDVSNSAACPLTLAAGFPNCAGITAENFGVDPNLRVGYLQTWQLNLQRDLPGALVVSANYLGAKGTRGQQQFLPNTYAPGAANPCPACLAGYVYRTSGGDSTRESGQLQVRRRLRSGFTASLQYTYSKSIDDDSQLGGQGHAAAASAAASSTNESAAAVSPGIAQNWLNLRGERGLSTFDQRHLLVAQLQYTTGQGMGGGTLLTGWRGRLIKEWTLLTDINTGSGLPETPVYLEVVPGTGITGTIRPNRTSAPIRQDANGYFLNAAAYTAPATGQWGNAGRNSINGPDQFSLNASAARTFRLRDPMNLDVRLDATNLLNHAVFTTWNTTVNSTTFGLPSAVNPMRSLQITGRLRF